MATKILLQQTTVKDTSGNSQVLKIYLNISDGLGALLTSCIVGNLSHISDAASQTKTVTPDGNEWQANGYTNWGGKYHSIALRPKDGNPNALETLVEYELKGAFEQNPAFKEAQEPCYFNPFTAAGFNTRLSFGNILSTNTGSYKGTYLLNVYDLTNRYTPNQTTLFDGYEYVYELRLKNEAPTPTPPKQTVNYDIHYCTSSALSEIEQGKEFSVILNSVDGYSFSESAPTLQYYETETTTKTLNFTLSDDLKSASLSTTIETLADGKAATISGYATKDVVIDNSATFVYDLSNCTISPRYQKASEVGSNYRATITANDGYIFRNAPTIRYDNENWGEIETTFDLSDDGKSATIEFGVLPNGDFSPAVNTNINITANAVGEPNRATVNYETSNCSNNGVTRITQGEAFTIVLTANDGFLFETKPKLTYETSITSESKVLEFVIASGAKSATLSATISDLKKNSVITVSGGADGQEPTYTAKFNYDGVVHCSVAPKPDEYNQGDQLKMNFVAEDGYFFNSNVYALVYFENFTTPQEFDGVVNADKRSAYIDFSTIATVKKGSVISIVAPAIREEMQYRLSTIFFPTDKQLYDLTKKRYYKIQVGEQVSDIQTYDLGEYILSMRKIFVDLPKDDVQEIQLGYFQTGIIAKTCDSIRYKVACGEREIVGLYENSLDYTNAQIEVELPFVGVQILDASKVMNRIIRIDYEINITAGVCCARLVDVGYDIVLYAFDGVCAIDIPYITAQGSVLNGSQMVGGELSVDNKALFQVTPKITIRQKKVVDNEILFGDVTNKFASLSNVEGFAVVENATIENIVCTDAERKMIESALNGGLIF